MHPGHSAAAFATTRWSVVRAAGASGADAAAALETLCRSCWPPIYAYIRRLGHGPEEARDHTQGFFAQLLARGSLAAAEQERGRFRSFLLGALKHYLADAHASATAAKRGGGVELLPLDTTAAEDSYAWEPADDLTPEHIFERRWALTLLARALERLEEESRLSGKAHLFATLKGFLSEGTAMTTYPEAARVLGLSEANVRMSVTRLRRRYGELVRAEVADTLGSHADLDDELRHLRTLLGGG
jgi:RNA polymerase sigma-70 factor (ECF subfamily)